jgi:hypothetical protein
MKPLLHSTTNTAGAAKTAALLKRVVVMAD